MSATETDITVPESWAYIAGYGDAIAAHVPGGPNKIEWLVWATGPHVRDSISWLRSHGVPQTPDITREMIGPSSLLSLD